ncbi:chemotaxis protein CheB [Marivirga salinae]|uniref:protein-glutamate methylesterase n=1 Tax=Marivirga salinarum TaxID=3059078 RepID=A0AA51NBF5_9BACT|nr:chemotaxis protein CheB [Marivirga sp. BDSF4-3]WMN11919.1 chemotaxis protein CheB [Marivirga sp. BDSF4-3]
MSEKKLKSNTKNSDKHHDSYSKNTKMINASRSSHFNQNDMTESDINNSCYIVGIGASSGGMEAIHSLFDNTPADGVSYVIIQHLSPNHKSFMAELLEIHSKLKICEVENEMVVKPNQVYTIPKGKNMTIRDKTLYLTDSIPKQTNTAVDIFFKFSRRRSKK